MCRATSNAHMFNLLCSALEEGIRKHSTTSDPFPGEGRVLGAPDMNVDF